MGCLPSVAMSDEREVGEVERGRALVAVLAGRFRRVCRSCTKP